MEGLECVKVELGEPDEWGKRAMQIVEGSEFVLPADMIIYATGQEHWKGLVDSVPGMDWDGKKIVVDPASGQTGNKKVFAGGDCTSGGADLVNAAAAGKLAAKGIIELLK